MQTSPPESVTVYDSLGKAQEKTVTRIAWDIAAAEKGGYDHFMLKEIMEQPNAIKSTIEPRIKDGEVVLDDFSLTDEELKNINKIMITACGSAYYAGQRWASMSSRTCAGFRWRQTWPRSCATATPWWMSTPCWWWSPSPARRRTPSPP